MGRIFRIIKFLLLKIFNFLKYIIVHLISRTLYFATEFIVCLICDIIYLVTFEPFTWKKATTRKAKRIRALTKFKLYTWKYCEPYFRFIHDDEYLEDLYNKFKFLIEEEK